MITPELTKRYLVTKRDNLWNIVEKSGLPPTEWSRIYNAPYNKQLRRKRPDPNLIYPGDVVILPYNEREKREELIKILKEAKRKTKNNLLEVRKHVAEQKRDFDKWSMGVDLTAFLLTFGQSLGGLVKQAHKHIAKQAKQAAKLGGKETLEMAKETTKFNNKMAKDVAVNSGKTAFDFLASALTITGEESQPVGALKSLAIAYCDLTSPSYWANLGSTEVRTGQSAADTIREAEHEVERHHEEWIRQFQKRIDKLEAMQ